MKQLETIASSGASTVTYLSVIVKYFTDALHEGQSDVSDLKPIHLKLLSNEWQFV
jgi:hypothetical protein